MCAHHDAKSRAFGGSMASWITWLGGADRLEPHERRERSAHAVAGVVVLINVALSWLATTLAVGPTTHRSAIVVALFTLVFAVLVGVTARTVATGPTRGTVRGGAAVAVVLALVLGGVVGEFAALALFSGSVDRVIHQQAARSAASAPDVVQLSSELQKTREARVALDNAVDAARAHRDEALVVARCEYHPTPACPQTRITGVPGSGPETRTANDVLTDSQRELDQAVAVRDGRAAQLESQISADERVLDQARQGATTDSDRDLGARWFAMQQVTSGSAGMLVLHVLTVGFFVFLSVLPLILRQWTGDTSHDRHAQARTERERAELMADTAIAVKRAEVRAAAETLWAEQQLAQARLAVEAQTEIDRAQLRQRDTAANEVTPRRPEPLDDDIYLPIAAEAHAASLAAAAPTPTEAANTLAIREPRDAPAIQGIPTIPDVTRAAARWIRPLVPDFVTRAIDTSIRPLRTARHVIEEVEHITFSLKRTRKLTVETEEGAGTSSVHQSASDDWQDGRDNEFVVRDAVAYATPAEDSSLASGRREPQRELSKRNGPGALRAANGPRQLPPAE